MRLLGLTSIFLYGISIMFPIKFNRLFIINASIFQILLQLIAEPKSHSVLILIFT